MACLPVACCLLLAALFLSPFRAFALSPILGLPACCLLRVACCPFPFALSPFRLVNHLFSFMVLKFDKKWYFCKLIYSPLLKNAKH
jgi:hypothetical protein